MLLMGTQIFVGIVKNTMGIFKYTKNGTQISFWCIPKGSKIKTVVIFVHTCSYISIHNIQVIETI